MKFRQIFLPLTVLVLASLACQAPSGGDNSPSPSSGGDVNSPTVPAQDNSVDGEGNAANTSNAGFLMTSDAYDILENSDGSLLFFTKFSLDDVLKFYRDEYTSRGYQERELLTAVSDNTINLVFDGDPGGKAILIQCVDLGDGSRTVAIRLVDI
jgi:hypothetical protein